MSDVINLSEYRDWLRDLKQQIKTGQMKAVLSVNSQMIMLYWDMGRQIAEKQEHARWGSGFIEQLSKDLREEFPEDKGFSAYNLRFMRIFYKFYLSIWEQAVPKLKTVEQPAKQLGNDGYEIVAQVAQQLIPQVVGQLQINVNQNDTIWEQVVPKLVSVPWGHHILLLKKVKDLNQALFYIHKTIENNWSRSVLEYHIETNLVVS